MWDFRTGFRMFLVLTILTGVVYPMAVTVVCQLFFDGEADGSLIKLDGSAVASRNVGQSFVDSVYFWSRPSAISYNPLPSSGSNLGPTSDALRKLVGERREALQTAHGARPAPSDLVLASGSGLDPHISPEAARYQMDRVVSARHLDDGQRNELLGVVNEYTEEPTFGLLGDSRVNVVKLNLALDSLSKAMK
jgi:K+-transporting ATPase ATPase C chain